MRFLRFLGQFVWTPQFRIPRRFLPAPLVEPKQLGKLETLINEVIRKHENRCRMVERALEDQAKAIADHSRNSVSFLDRIIKLEEERRQANIAIVARQQENSELTALVTLLEKATTVGWAAHEMQIQALQGVPRAKKLVHKHKLKPAKKAK